MDQLFPPAPKFTEKDLLDLSGKVYIISGGNTGIGFELAKILYCKGGTIYIAARSEKKALEAITTIKSEIKNSNGTLTFLSLDLSDLLSVKAAAEDFLRKEKRLDVLFNNAGLTHPGVGSKTKQGYEMTMGTNCLGPYLLTSLLVPILRSTAKSASTGSVRIVFAASSAVEMSLNPHGGMDFGVLQKSPFPKFDEQQRNYCISKSGNWLLAAEFDRHLRSDGIISLAQNPGNLKTKTWDATPWYIRIPCKLVLHDIIFGAYTVLWCGLSKEVKLEDGGRYAVPWGSWHKNPRKDILDGLKTKEEGGTGVSARFWEWCEEACKAYT